MRVSKKYNFECWESSLWNWWKHESSRICVFTWKPEQRLLLNGCCASTVVYHALCPLTILLNDTKTCYLHIACLSTTYDLTTFVYVVPPINTHTYLISTQEQFFDQTAIQPINPNSRMIDYLPPVSSNNSFPRMNLYQIPILHYWIANPLSNNFF